MKLRGGYLPKIAGRPSSIVETIPPPQVLKVALRRKDADYTPLVASGQTVALGDPLAAASVDGKSLILPSPGTGKVTIEEGRKSSQVVLKLNGSETEEKKLQQYHPERITGEEMREVLVQSGIWPFFWSSHTGGTPTLNASERPKAIIVNCVLTEPFRARGKVILRHSWSRILEGIRFLPRLLEDYGTIEIILTAKRDPVTEMMTAGLAGYAWVRFHKVPYRYPAENHRILGDAYRKYASSLNTEDVIWAIDVQGIEALGACLSEGIPVHERIIALGGPGQSNPRHLSVRIGTPIQYLVGETEKEADVTILKGGLLTGEQIDPSTDSIQYDDDGLFFSPDHPLGNSSVSCARDLTGTSARACFLSQITGSPDRHISSSLRGQRRPCIACGLCEKVCPAGLFPQILHRYLYAESFDEAEAAGLDLCVDCGLCTYVCPSKIELQQQFTEAKEILRVEREETLTASLANETNNAMKESLP